MQKFQHIIVIKASLAVKVGLEHTAAIEKAKYSGIFSCLTNRIVSSFVRLSSQLLIPEYPQFLK